MLRWNALKLLVRITAGVAACQGCQGTDPVPA